jgi:L-threonylcarbamoyladenylate synthase
VAEVVDATGDRRPDAVERALATLTDSGLVVLPTDTVYGLAADAFDRVATGRIASAKGRDRRVPLPVFVRSPKQLIGLTPSLPAAAELLMAAYWPGPLTLVLHAETGLRWDLGESEGTIAVRMPLDEVALAVVRAVGPLAVTSAAKAGGAPPRTVEEAREQLGDEVDLYVDDGARAGGVTSTIVDLTGARPRILRSGALPDDEVLAVARGELDPMEASAVDPATGTTGADGGGEAGVAAGPDGGSEVAAGPDGGSEVAVGPDGGSEVAAGSDGGSEVAVGPDGGSEVAAGPDGGSGPDGGQGGTAVAGDAGEGAGEQGVGAVAGDATEGAGGQDGDAVADGRDRPVGSAGAESPATTDGSGPDPAGPDGDPDR